MVIEDGEERFVGPFNPQIPGCWRNDQSCLGLAETADVSEDSLVGPSVFGGAEREIDGRRRPRNTSGCLGTEQHGGEGVLLGSGRNLASLGGQDEGVLVDVDPTARVEDGEVAAHAAQALTDRGRVGDHEVDHLVCPERQRFGGQQRKVGRLGLRKRVHPDRVSVFGRNACVRVVDLLARQPGRAENRVAIEAQPSSRIEDGSAGHREDRGHHPRSLLSFLAATQPKPEQP